MFYLSECKFLIIILFTKKANLLNCPFNSILYNSGQIKNKLQIFKSVMIFINILVLISKSEIVSKISIYDLEGNSAKFCRKVHKQVLIMTPFKKALF
jgi:hypothetical protein